MKFKKVLAEAMAAGMLIGSVAGVGYANDEIQVLLDNKKIEFDVQPQLVNDRTMVPMRAIFESLGAEVIWNEETETITSTRTVEDDKTKEEREITLQVGSSAMYLDGDRYYKLKDRSVSLDKEVTLDSAAFILDDRTMVPLRAISEAFGLYVGWDGDTNTVYISTLNGGIESVSHENYDLFASIIKENADKRLVGEFTDHDGSRYYAYSMDCIADFTKDLADPNIIVAALEYRLYDDRIEISYERYKTRYGYEFESVYFTYYDDLSRDVSIVLGKDDTSLDAYYVYGLDGYELTYITDESIKDTADAILSDTIERIIANTSASDMHFIGIEHTELFY